MALAQSAATDPTADVGTLTKGFKCVKSWETSSNIYNNISCPVTCTHTHTHGWRDDCYSLTNRLTYAVWEMKHNKTNLFCRALT